MSYLTSATYASDGGSGYASGGGGWDLTFKVGAIDTSAAYVAAATAPGWTTISYQNTFANVRGSCYWNSAYPLGSGDTVPLTCQIVGVSGPSAVPQQSSSAAPKLQLLQEAKASDDVLPEWVKPDVLGIKPDTARHLAASASADYWAARNNSNQTGLVTLALDASHNAAASCTDASTFNQRGLALRLDSGATRGEPAYLLPDNVVTTGKNLPGASNLVVPATGSKAALSSGSSLRTTTGSPFALVPLDD